MQKKCTVSGTEAEGDDSPSSAMANSERWGRGGRYHYVSTATANSSTAVSGTTGENPTTPCSLDPKCALRLTGGTRTSRLCMDFSHSLFSSRSESAQHTLRRFCFIRVHLRKTTLIVFELLCLVMLSNLLVCLRLNLSDTFTSDTELFTYLFKGMCNTVRKTVTKLEDLSLLR